MSHRPGRGGYVVAAVVAVLTVVAVVLLAVSGIGDVRSSEIAPVRAGEQVEIGEQRLALWSTAGPDTEVECRLGSPDGFITLARPTASVTAGSWHRVAVAPDWVEPGSYALQCRDLPAGVDLGVGNDPPVGTLVLRFVGALVVGGLGLVVVIALVALTLWRRHRRPRPPAARMEVHRP